eukprot:TRINITY_DN11789_c0_g1_i1.p1 TRINITY_DN11789_c0_g1~~TRINITY_DN11789_c0_g1_i1.p1  ORF type:complete len:135 (-),score=21.87 TRINITY_DN11789_c0_g1_i1:11-415(-)
MGTGVISWSSKKQPSMALSSSGAEYMAVTAVACQAIWMRKILGDIKQTQMEATTIYCDNQSTIAMAKNPVHYNRTRHIETRHHFIRELVRKGEIEYYSTNDQLADLFTKPLQTKKFMYLRELLGVGSFYIKGEC